MTLKNMQLKHALMSLKDRQIDVNIIKQKLEQDQALSGRKKLPAFNVNEINNWYTQLKQESIRE